jgi:hypothetical protein
MFEGKTMTDAAGKSQRSARAAIILAQGAMSGAFCRSPQAAANLAPASGDGATPARIYELLILLAEERLEKQRWAKHATPSTRETANSVEDKRTLAG